MANLDDLIHRWHLGWQSSRDLPDAELTDDAIWVHCVQPGREFEVFSRRADEDPDSVRRLAARVLAARDHTWLTVTTDDLGRAAAAVEAAGLRVLHRSETMMAADLTRHPRRPLDPAFTSEVQVKGPCISVLIHDAAGTLAARGQIGIAGGDAVADRIETTPEFRRRGLGAVVMGALAAEAASRGVHNGLLIASEEGRHLYSSLGWERVADVLIAQPPAV
ncbi:MAG: N-acetyltransferase [Catenulispora sp.]|nr:N-acetyltransferase [Catenulispora sp.]